jgi:hypothetical protein
MEGRLMPYFPVDDDMAFHPKILAAGNEAIGMWTRAGALCKKHATGGFVSTETARALGSKRTADRLVAAGLFIEVDGGYHFHDWKQQAGNDDADVEKERADRARERNAERQRRWRERNSTHNGVNNPPVTDSPSPSPMTDFYSPSQSQSSNDRARVSTDALKVSEMTRRLAGQQGITSLRAVVDAIHRHTSCTVTADQAFQVSVWILGKAKQPPAVPQRYVTGAIAKSPAEVEQHIYEAVA